MDDDIPPLSNQLDQCRAVVASASTQQPFAQGQGATLATFTTRPTAPALRKGFLNRVPLSDRHPAPKDECRGCKPDSLYIVTGDGSHGKAPAVPDCTRIPVSPEEQRLHALQGALRPTCESMAALTQDAELLCGFDDPDVMAAVAEIASSPGALQKYAHNAKVAAFYNRMGRFVTSRMEQQGRK